MQSTWPQQNRHGARFILRRALALGILADLLLRGGPFGLGPSLWLLALAGAAAGPVLRARGVSRTSALEPAALVLLAAVAITWRASPFLRLLSMGLLGIAGSIALLRAAGASPGRTGALGFVEALARGAWGTAKGAAPVLPRVVGGSPGIGRLRPRAAVAARGLLLAAPLLLLFGVLFSEADPAFGSFLGRGADFLAGPLPSHVLMAGAFAWISAGGLWALRAHDRTSSLEVRPPRTLGAGEVLVVLVLVDLLFASFLAFQAGYLFGGRELVQATEGMGYAAYARRGFFELVAAAAVVLPLLLLAEWAVREDEAGSARWARRLARLLVVLVAILLASAGHRMLLYQQTFGLTELRVYTSAFMVWLALAFAWSARTLLAGRPERFPAGALRAGAAIVALLLVLDPAGTIVRVNAARAAVPGTPELDVPHLLSLGPDAVPETVSLLDELEGARRCTLARGLLRRWEGGEPRDWRSWNAARWRARRAVEERRDALERVADRCPESEPPGDARPGTEPSPGS